MVSDEEKLLVQLEYTIEGVGVGVVVGVGGVVVGVVVVVDVGVVVVGLRGVACCSAETAKLQQLLGGRRQKTTIHVLWTALLAAEGGDDETMAQILISSLSPSLSSLLLSQPPP